MERRRQTWGHWLAGALLAIALPAIAETQLGGRDFNHMTTGFPLSGVHAAVACETCHAGGVFKGTPRNCDGCHAPGGRVVATPKSTNHIVTDAPCEICHFNTSTFLGARYNHGTARTGQCATCHNGRIAAGKPAKHVVTNYSCDSCHRSSSWVPASWNHNGVTQDCSACHRAAGPGRNFSAATHLSLPVMAGMGLSNCSTCHKSYYSFFGAFYDHAGAPTLCQNCHKNPAYGPGVKQMSLTPIHTVFLPANPAVTCQSCHKSYAVGSFPSASYDHAGASPACETCHNNAAYAAAGVKQIVNTAKHTIFTTVGITACRSCHTSYGAGTFTTAHRYDHAGQTLCQNCHTAAYSPTIRAMATNHVPISTAATCTACHYSATSWAAESMNHALAAPGSQCITCHLKTATYLGRMQKKGYGHEGFVLGQDCSTCHGVNYSTWHK